VTEVGVGISSGAGSFTETRFTFAATVCDGEHATVPQMMAPTTADIQIEV